MILLMTIRFYPSRLILTILIHWARWPNTFPIGLSLLQILTSAVTVVTTVIRTLQRVKTCFRPSAVTVQVATQEMDQWEAVQVGFTITSN